MKRKYFRNSILVLIILVSFGIVNIKAETNLLASTRAMFRIEVPSEAEKNSVGNWVQAIYTLDIISQDLENDTITLDVGSYWSMSGLTVLYNDYFFLDDVYVGTFKSNNGRYENGGYAYRDEKFTVTLKAHKNYYFSFKGEDGSDLVGGDAEQRVNLNPPSIVAKDGTWLPGEVASGLRTWQSLYTDGATGSVEGNKVQTGTGFMYYDVEDAPGGVGTYDNNVIAYNSGLSKIVDETRGVTYDGWAAMQDGLQQMNNSGVYRIYTHTTDSQGFRAEASRKITVNSPPTIQAIDGTWRKGDVASGLRTWQSLYTDGATGSAEGNKVQTATGFRYYDPEEAPNGADAYENNPIALNASMSKVVDETRGVTYSGIDEIQKALQQMNELGVYRIYSYTKDSHGATATASRKVTVVPKAYNVTWQNFNGNVLKTEIVEEGESAHPPAVPSRIGYGFTGWDKAYDKIYEDTVITAQFQPIKYDIHFEGNGNTGGNTPDMKSVVFDVPTPLTPNGFIRQYNVMYDANGGNASKQNEIAEATFTNWTSATGGTYLDKAVVKGLALHQGMTIKMTANWKLAEITLPTVTKANSTFMGWYSSEGKFIGYAGTKYTPTADTKFVAKWDEVPFITAPDKTFYQGEYTTDEWINSLRMKSVSASDKEDGNITSKIKVIYDNVDVNTPGVYKVTYEVTDSAGMTVKTDAKVTVLYNNPPVINAKDKTFYENQYTQDYWQNTLRMKDVSANDIEDGNLTNKVKITYDNVDVTKPGKYKVTYSVTDSFGKTATKDVVVTVLYNNPPVINAKDQTFYENQYTKEYWEKTLRWKDVSANDTEDGNLTSKVKVTYDNVDVTKPGKYKVTYSVTDSFGKTATKDVVVTVLYNNPPVIDAKDQTFYENQYTKEYWEKTLRMKDVSANDTEDGNLTSKVKVTYDNVDVTKPGKYKVTYSVTDSFGKTTTKDVVVTVLYNNPPVINAKDQTFYENQYTKEYWEKTLRWKDVSASDVEDGNLTSKVKITYDNVDVTKPGKYKVTYSVTDSFGKTTIKDVVVTVLYNNPPVINAKDQTFYENQYSKDYWQKTLRWKDVSASDVEDGDLTSKIKIITDTVDVSKPGVYKVVYIVTDSLGKMSMKEVKVTVLFNEAPVINAFDQTFYEGQYTHDEWINELRMKDVTASDKEDGNLTDRVVVTYDNVDVTTPGKYKVTYSVTDSFGKTTTKDVVITVLFNNPPTIKGEDRWFYITEDITDEMLLERVKANDVEDGDISDKVTIKYSNVVEHREGEYKVTYEVIDQYGKSAETTVTIHIVTNIPEGSDRTQYLRYISKDYMDTLKENSVWSSGDKAAMLANTLNKTSPSQAKEHWKLTADDIEKIKQFNETHNWSQESNQEFLRIFAYLKQ